LHDAGGGVDAGVADGGAVDEESGVAIAAEAGDAEFSVGVSEQGFGMATGGARDPKSQFFRMARVLFVGSLEFGIGPHGYLLNGDGDVCCGLTVCGKDSAFNGNFIGGEMEDNVTRRIGVIPLRPGEAEAIGAGDNYGILPSVSA